MRGISPRLTKSATILTRSNSTTLGRLSQQIQLDVLTPSQVDDNLKEVNRVTRNFISDTVTVPTSEMFAYGRRASLGDDVFHEPCTKSLEEHVAKLAGKEAGLFLPSGTMSNQIAIRAHLKEPPTSVLLDKRSHIYLHEAGGTAFFSGAQEIPVLPTNGHHLTVSDVIANIVEGDDVHLALTKLITLENTLNGTIFPHDDIVSISDFAHARGIKMHLDGSRIWHVAAEALTPLKELCDPFDSVNFCFSKGLGAPIGSCLVGSSAFIRRARWLRKLFGGGMRQTGFLAACAAYALTHNFSLLPAVHALTRKLEKGLEEIGAKITSRAETCMVFYDPSPLGLDYSEIDKRASQLPDPITLQGPRLVVHIQTSEAAINNLLQLIKEMAYEKASTKLANN